ncbi:MAG: DNA-formamidopyrimidine glycosylase family protein [Micropruina sp.]|uniref:DNA-formamidopyrimidine glycosylase family protein n=1 Tax=Micropruina sp. TaxID=2737536 RepID=UPI0039E5755D
MPEGDTVWRTAQRLNQAFAGESLTRADLRWPGVSTVDLAGDTTIEVVSRGKHLLHRLDSDYTIHSHLRMEGQWRITDAAAARPDAQTRAFLSTVRWAGLGQRLGMLDVVRTDAESTVVGHLGPDVLGPDWDAAQAAANLAAAGTTIGAALLDQSNLAGVGTLYAAESLFAERLNPWTPTGELTDTQLASLVDRVHRLLDVGRRSVVQSTTGSTRRGETHWVHARSGLPCRRCGDTVRVAMIGPPTRQRTMFYCPTCQGGLGPTDDGRPQRPLGRR